MAQTLWFAKYLNISTLEKLTIKMFAMNVFVSTRMWRKNKSPNSQGCMGVDINRNFDYHWNEVGSSDDPCNDVYSGRYPFSERESSSLRDYMMRYKNRLKMYLSLHSYGNYILHPWSFTFSLPSDADDLKRIADEVNDAMVRAGSDRYKVGSSANVLNLVSGSSDDFAKGEIGIDRSFKIELPGGGGHGFDLPPYAIEHHVRQVFEGIRVFAKYARR